jgi:hypothetical protein
MRSPPEPRPPSLRDLQRAFARSIVDRDDAGVGRHVVAAGIASARRLAVYRNTFDAALEKALRLAFPAVHRLIGAGCFTAAARAFAHEAPPRSACLDEYGDRFPRFLASFPATAQLGYLADVGRLEWAVNRALHAPDAAPLRLAALAELAESDRGRVILVAHPSVSLVTSVHPVDSVWRAVLARDDAALARIDLADGPVHVLVERVASSIEVTRVAEHVYRLAADLVAGTALDSAVRRMADDAQAPALLAGHLAAGRFVDFRLAGKRRRAREAGGR